MGVNSQKNTNVLHEFQTQNYLHIKTTDDFIKNIVKNMNKDDTNEKPITSLNHATQQKVHTNAIKTKDMNKKMVSINVSPNDIIYKIIEQPQPNYEIHIYNKTIFLEHGWLGLFVIIVVLCKKIYIPILYL
jgi:hypothetical protein